MVGVIIVSFIKELYNVVYLVYNKVYLVGYSLGLYILGYVGECVYGVGRIMGMVYCWCRFDRVFFFIELYKYY